MGCEFTCGLENEVDCLSRDLTPLVLFHAEKDDAILRPSYHFDKAPKISSENLKKIMQYPVEISDLLKYNTSILTDIDETASSNTPGFHNAMYNYFKSKGMAKNHATRFSDTIIYGSLCDVLKNKFPNEPQILISALFVLHDCVGSAKDNLRICDADVYLYGSKICNSCLEQYSKSLSYNSR